MRRCVAATGIRRRFEGLIKGLKKKEGIMAIDKGWGGK